MRSTKKAIKEGGAISGVTHIAGQRTQNNEADARKRKTAGAAEATGLSAHFSHALGNKISRQVAKSG